MLLLDALDAATEHGAAAHLAQYLQVVMGLARHAVSPSGLTAGR